jgi:hypothetical protein
MKQNCQKRWDEIKTLIINQLIKSIFTILVAVFLAVCAVCVWENQKMQNGVSFEKKIEIIADERNSLMDYAYRFTEDWDNMNEVLKGLIKQGLTKENYQSSDTYRITMKKLSDYGKKTDMILASRLIKSDSIEEFHTQLIKNAQLLVGKMEKNVIDYDLYKKIYDMYDKIIALYSKEIIKYLKEVPH